MHDHQNPAQQDLVHGHRVLQMFWADSVRHGLEHGTSQQQLAQPEDRRQDRDHVELREIIMGYLQALQGVQTPRCQRDIRIAASAGAGSGIVCLCLGGPCSSSSSSGGGCTCAIGDETGAKRS